MTYRIIEKNSCVSSIISEYSGLCRSIYNLTYGWWFRSASCVCLML